MCLSPSAPQVAPAEPVAVIEEEEIKKPTTIYTNRDDEKEIQGGASNRLRIQRDDLGPSTATGGSGIQIV